MTTISIVVPAYNEEATILTLLGRVRDNPVEGFGYEVIVIDDGSTDQTLQLLEQNADLYSRLISQPVNQGKGAAVQKGFEAATGEYVLIQDADLEYDPADYRRLFKPIVESDADVVFGSRFRSGESARVLYFWHSLANNLLTLMSNVFTDLNLTDMECCYKLLRTDIARQINIKEKRFGIEPEITAKICKIKPLPRIFEVGISYSGRTYAEGKKIGWKDGVRAFYCIIRYNLFR